MKKIILTILIIILLTACTSTKQTDAKNTPTGAIVAQEKPAQQEEQKEIPLAPIEKIQPKEEITPAELPPAPSESKIIIEKSRQFSPELRDLLQKADNEVKSVQYIYAESPDNVGFDEYLIKGTKMKILLFEKNDYVIDDYYNAVYVDTEKKLARGKCENRRRCISQEIDNTKRVYDLPYEKYIIKTPYQWIKEIDYAEIIGFETLNNHAVTKIQTEKDGARIEMWVDNRFGLPHKIRITKDDKEKVYYFKNMLFNVAKDTDVILK